MGIIRFGLRMRSYASRNALGSSQSPAKDSIAIIDGPGLAHYVFYQLCDAHHSSAADFSYAACVDAVIQWLRDLQSIGFKIEAIFFDGALPDSKKDVRIGRLQSYTERLVAHKQSIGSASPVLSGSARKMLSPPPFLVFAIVEELLHHEDFSSVTFIVPGEADPYCVAAAQTAETDSTIAIFSDDADLLVYRLGQCTSVVPFRDLSISKADPHVVWTGEQYWPHEISKRFSVDDLIKPAYFMAQDSYLSLEEACRRLKATNPSKRSDFVAFEKTFQTTDEVAEWANIRNSHTSEAAGAGKDSRVAELLHQVDQDQGILRMYLPFILDDPAKKTAWIIGTDLRTIAYSVLLHQNGSDASLQEYRRSGSRIVSSMVEQLSKEQTSTQVEQLSTHIEQVLNWARSTHDLSQADAWRYIVLQHTLSSLQADGYPLPSAEDAVQVVTNGEQPQWHWIHLSGQYQAAFYSFRMMKQLAHHAVAQEDQQDSQWLKTLRDVGEQMKSLPRISSCFGQSETEPSVWHLIVQELLSTLDARNNEEPERPRKKAKKSKKSGQSQSAALEKNPFAMLADD